MKIIFLNIWGGKVFDPLMEFLKESAHDTDFFCFQEVFDSPPHQRVGSGGSPEAREVSWGGRANILFDLHRVLPNFAAYFAPAVEGFDGDNPVDFPLSLGLAIFSRSPGIKITHFQVPPLPISDHLPMILGIA